MNDAENQDVCEWQPKAVSIELLGYLGATEVVGAVWCPVLCLERISQVSQVVPHPIPRLPKQSRMTLNVRSSCLWFLSAQIPSIGARI